MSATMPGGAKRSMERFSAAVVSDTAAKSWFTRHEGPTALVALAIYASWALLLAYHAAFPAWLLALMGGYVVQWHFSLQHEAIHGWRTLPPRLRTAIVWPPLGLWFPFELYRRSHSQHHRNVHLTYPDEDTETYYHPEERWDRYGRVWLAVLMANQTLLGRLLLGPFIRPPRIWWREAKRLVGGDLTNAGVWVRHFAGLAAVLAIADAWGVSPLQYVLCFMWPGMMYGMLRTFIEHRWGERPAERTAVIESNAFFGLLFLWNNLHAVHHTFPTLPWFQVRRVWRQHRARILEHNGGYVFTGYFEVARRWLVRPVFIPVHPKSRHLGETYPRTRIR